MRFRKAGLVLFAVALIVPWLWLPGLMNDDNMVPLTSQYFGMTALIAMSFSQLIATRWLLVERLFGPLDQSYRLHKWMGLWALFAMLMHDTVDADIDSSSLRSALGEIAETAGEIGLNGILILVILTVATFIPYHLWKWTHRLIGIFFVLSAFHYLFIERPFSNSHPLGIYMGLICLMGLLAYIYTSAPRRFRRAKRYRVERLEKQGDALAVTLAPRGESLRFRAGQFAFISFSDIGLSEPHPFTLSAGPSNNGRLRISIGALGDYTVRLMSLLEVGVNVRVEGPFGDFATVRGPQTWVAAGIGITPFVAMADALTPQDGPVTLFYSVNKRAKAAHIDELEATAASHSNFELVLRETAIEGRLTADSVLDKQGSFEGRHLLFCGPAALRDALWVGLRKHGLKARRFHFELFEIRTGIGLTKLFNHILKRTGVAADKA